LDLNEQQYDQTADIWTS